MSKNNSLTTFSKSVASGTTNLRQGGVHYLEEPKELTNIEDITAELAAENQRRLNDVGGGIGRFLNWLFFGSKKNTQSAPAIPQKTFHEKLDEEIEKKPKKLEFHIQKIDSYATVPSPRIYNSSIDSAEKTTVELLKSKSITSTSLESGNVNYENFLQQGLDKLYLYFKIREIPRIKADSLGMTDDDQSNFHKRLNEAGPNLELASKLDQSSAIPVFYEGIFHLFARERLKPAQSYFKKALELDPAMPWANHFLGLTLKGHQARRHFETELQHNRNPQSLQQLAQLDFVEKKYDRALVRFEEALALDPKARLAHLRISEIYRHKGEPEKELEHLNKELENAHHHRDQKLANRISRDLGYYNLRQGNPQQALEFFDYAATHRMAHERNSVFHLFDKANAVAMINGAQKAEEDLLKVTRKQFIKSGTQPRVTTAPVYLEPFKLLSEFRIKHYGLQESREKLEEQLKEAEKIRDPKPQESQLRLSLKTELATLLYVHARTLNKDNPEKLELFEESKKLLSEKSKNNPSYQSIKEDFEKLLRVKNETKTPNNSPQKPSHQKVEESRSASHVR